MLNADSYLLVGAAVYLQIGIRLDGRRGEAVVLSPGGEGRGHGEARGHQLFQLAVLNGQHRLAGGRQQLIGQGQGQTGGAGDGTNGNFVHGVLLSLQGLILRCRSAPAGFRICGQRG